MQRENAELMQLAALSRCGSPEQVHSASNFEDPFISRRDLLHDHEISNSTLYDCYDWTGKGQFSRPLLVFTS